MGSDPWASTEQCKVPPQRASICSSYTRKCYSTAQSLASGRVPTGLSKEKKHWWTPDGAPFSCPCPEPLTLARHDQASVGPKEVGRTHGNFPRDVPGKGDSLSLLMKAVAQRQRIPSPRELDPSALLSEVAAIWKLTRSLAAIPEYCIK